MFTRYCEIKVNNLNNKVIIVTGANTGIGFETALSLSNLGATVILACRDEIRGKTAEKKIKEKNGNNKAEFMKLDLSDFSSIRLFVNEFT